MREGGRKSMREGNGVRPGKEGRSGKRGKNEMGEKNWSVIPPPPLTYSTYI